MQTKVQTKIKPKGANKLQTFNAQTESQLKSFKEISNQAGQTKCASKRWNNFQLKGENKLPTKRYKWSANQKGLNTESAKRVQTRSQPNGFTRRANQKGTNKESLPKGFDKESTKRVQIKSNQKGSNK